LGGKTRQQHGRIHLSTTTSKVKVDAIDISNSNSFSLVCLFVCLFDAMLLIEYEDNKEVPGTAVPVIVGFCGDKMDLWCQRTCTTSTSTGAAEYFVYSIRH
jgi:hypothetical protein